MKRPELIKFLEKHGCHLMREGGRHCVYLNPQNHNVATLPRHDEVAEDLVKEICKDLELELEWVMLASDQPEYTAHKHSIYHREEVLRSDLCGCFFCLRIFPSTDIQDWVDDKEETALCPHCRWDSVIGAASGFPISSEFLQRMHRLWFG